MKYRLLVYCLIPGFWRWEVRHGKKLLRTGVGKSRDHAESLGRAEREKLLSTEADK